MDHRILLAIGLACAVALPSTALASHMSSDQMNPVEHDDLGRSDEPNFAGTSTILGPAIAEHNIDVGLTGLGSHYAPVSGSVIAPGCTAQTPNGPQRDLSGKCGLYTVGVGEALPVPNPNGPDYGNVVPPGMLGDGPTDGSFAPGRFTPTKSTVIGFLDGRADLMLAASAAGTVYLDSNHVLQDQGVEGALMANGIGGGVQAFGPVALWSWFGQWRDLNGNGVIDALQKTCPADDNGVPTCEPVNGGEGPGNEFQWYGRCIDKDGHDAPPGLTQCIKRELTMPDWIIPGDHHSTCIAFNVDLVGAECLTPLTAGTDLPARQVLCFVDIVALTPAGANGVLPASCPFNSGHIQDMDNYDQDTAGDPIFGPQNSVRVDDVMADRTGDPGSTTRMWLGGIGWATPFYDNGVLVTTTIVTGATSQTQVDQGNANYYSLVPGQANGPMKYLDVDVYQAFSPATDALLQGTVKPLARSSWVTARDGFIVASDTLTAAANNRLTYDLCDTAYLAVGCPVQQATGVDVRGTLNAQPDPLYGLDGVPAQDREPNNPLDREPGAVYRAFAAGTSSATLPGLEEHQGWRNSYAGYRAWHGFVDVQDQHGTYTSIGTYVNGKPVNPVFSTAVLGEPDILGDGAPLPQGDHTQVLNPGGHVFNGVVGGWRDRTQHHDEVVYDALGSINDPAAAPKQVEYKYDVPPDGWPGDIVNNTGAQRSRGYAPEACKINNATATREWAVCHPTRDGNLGLGTAQSFATDATTGGEFQGPEHGPTGPGSDWFVTLTPNTLTPGASDCWTVPILVWQNFLYWNVGDTNAIQNFQGRCGEDAKIRLRMSEGPALFSAEQLILPLGNLGQTVYSDISGTVVFQPPTENGVSQPAVSELVRDVDVYAPYTSP